MKRKNKGFSLTEVIITVVIIVVLSAISGPIYNSYTTKSKQAEGYILLGTIKDAEMKWYNDTGVFYKYSLAAGYSTCYNPILGIDARSNKYYTCFNTGNWSYSPDESPSFRFRAVVYAQAAAAITMIYNITSGTTYK